MRKVTAAVASMLIGGMLYVSLRSESLIMFRWFHLMGILGFVRIFRVLAAPYVDVIPRWVFLSLPQALWYFSGLLGFKCIWSSGAGTCQQGRAWMFAFSGSAFGFEVGQLFHLVPGRFDLLDLLLLLLAASAVVTMDYFERRGRWDCSE